MSADHHRSCGVLPVRPDLRPKPPALRQPNGTCLLFGRRDEPAVRGKWRYYDVIDRVPIEEAEDLPVRGEA